MTMGIAVILGMFNSFSNKLSPLADENGQIFVDEFGQEFFI